jgi:hypothetical protein
VSNGAFCFSIVVGSRINYPRLRLLNPTLFRFRNPDPAVGAAVSLKLTKMRLSLWKISVPSRSAFAQRPSSVSRPPIAGSALLSIAHIQFDTLELE